MKKLKKLLALALAVIMMLSVAPAVFAEDATEPTDDTGLTIGDIFGGFFIKLGELLNTIFEFLSNLFSGSNGNGALDAIK